MTQSEWMEKGCGEGFIVTGKNSIAKWKIGAYPDNRNADIIKKFKEAITAEDVFGDLTDKACAAFDELLKVQGSNDQVKPPGSDEDYMEAIKSAMSKYDTHENFEDDVYIDMIIKETTEDMQKNLESEFKEAAHKKKIEQMLNKKFKIRRPKPAPKPKVQNPEETKQSEQQVEEKKANE